MRAAFLILAGAWSSGDKRRSSGVSGLFDEQVRNLGPLKKFYNESGSPLHHCRLIDR